jgi:threonine dehydrogenase-like Zn-dependent dehydrogenase
MRAAVTREPNVMEVEDVPDARDPGPGEARLRPEAIGLCGSDYHFLTGEIVTTTVHGPQFPKIQGHEVSAIIEKLGPDAPAHLEEGQRVAIWPLRGCGECYACSIGRSNVCPNFSLIGIHVDGALAESITLPAQQLFPVGDLGPTVTAFVEPISIAVHAVNRGRVADGERVVVLGAGPIGQAVCLAARDRGAAVLVADLVPERLEHARAMGAQEVVCGDGAEVVEQAREWAGGDGVPVMIETTGVPAVVRSAFDGTAPAGRLVLVALSHHEVSLPLIDFPIRELDVLGVSCCNAAEFADAVDLVRRHEAAVARLITDEFAFEQAPDALAYVADGAPDLMKAVINVAS